VHYLCRKFEELASQLRQEERTHELADRRGKVLASEVEAAEYEATKSLGQLAFLEEEGAVAIVGSSSSSSHNSCTYSGKGHGDAILPEAVLLRQQRSSEEQQEKLCAALAAECCREEASYNKVATQLLEQDHERVLEQNNEAEVRRRLRQLEADQCVMQGDLRLAGQHEHLLCSEAQALEQALQAASSAQQAAHEEMHARAEQQADCNHEFWEAECQLEALVQQSERRMVS